MIPDLPIYGGIECGNGASASSAPKVLQRPRHKAKSTAGTGRIGYGSATAGRQIFAVNGTEPARHDRRAEPGHSTSEMIQEDMKIL